MLSDHADTQRHEMLVKLAVQKSDLTLNVALQRANRCEDTMAAGADVPGWHSREERRHLRTEVQN